MAGAHSRHRCPLRREDPLIIIAFQSGRVVFHPGEDNGWKKWKSKRERRRRRVGWEKGGEEGKEKKSILLGSGGGNSNWNRERDLSSARDVSRGTVLFRRTKGTPISRNLYFDRNAKVCRSCRGRNFVSVAVSVSEIVAGGGGGEGVEYIFSDSQKFSFNSNPCYFFGRLTWLTRRKMFTVCLLRLFVGGGTAAYGRERGRDWLVSRDTRRGAIDKTRGHSRGCS